jgi:hypothetical protein
VTIETLTDASVRATQGMSPNSAGGSANEVFQSFPSGESLERDLGVPSRWNDGVDALVGDTYVSISASGVEKDMRPSLLLLAESVVGHARQAGGATTSTGST